MEAIKAKAPDTGLPYHPAYAQYYKNVIKGEQTGEREVTFTFDVKGNRELPFITGELFIFPKHYWTGKDASGKPRDITKTTLEPPLGSGPYKVKALRPSDWIAFERVPGYWGKDLPARRGQNNFDTIEFQYYGDRSVSMEAFKSGQYDFKQETSAKAWATAYDFPALKEGRVVKREVVLERPKPMQGFAFNLRQAQVSGRARAPRLQSGLRFRMGESEPLFRAIHENVELFPGAGTSREGLAVARGVGAAGALAR